MIPTSLVFILISVLAIFLYICSIVIILLFRVSGKEIKWAERWLLYLSIPIFISALINPLITNSIVDAVAGKTQNPSFCDHRTETSGSYGSRSDCFLAASGVREASEIIDCKIFNPNKQPRDYNSCIIAEAERTNQATLCSKIFDETSKARCVRAFIGTDEWENICNQFLEQNFFSPIITGRCLTNKTVNNLFPTSKPSGGTVPAWFRAVHSGAFFYDKTEDVFLWLAEIGADPNLRDGEGMTVLAHGFNYSSFTPGIDIEKINRMIEFGVDPNSKDYNNHDALYYAENGTVPISKEVIDHLRSFQK